MKARNSFFLKIFFTLVLATFLEGVLFIGSLNVSKSFETIEQESISLFEQRIRYRTADVHKALVESLHKESNYNDLLKNCDQLYANRANIQDHDAVLGEKEVNDLLLLLHSRSISGAFVILDKDVFQTSTYPTIYLRDSSPDIIHNDNSDISARYGNAELLKKNNLSLDANWHPAIPIDKNNELYQFYTRPFQEASIHPDLDELDYGYWGDPIQFEGEAREVITYSFPIIAEDGTTYGVIGIDITADMLKEMFDYSELNEGNQTAYILAKKTEDNVYSVVYCNGPAYSYALKQGSKITLENTFMNQTHEMHISSSTTQLASANNLEFYPSNSPIDTTDWYLIGISDKGELLESSTALKRNAYIAISLSMAIGIAAAILISIKFLRPIKKLIRHLKHANVNEQVELPRVNINEIDELSSSVEELSLHLLSAESRMSQVIHATEFPMGAIESFGKDTYYVTENVAELLDFPKELHNKQIIPITTFTNALDKFEKHAQLVEEHEEQKDEKTIHTYVYRYEKDDDKRWIRFTYSMQKESRVFIVMDVSKEFKEKESLTYERDHDALTGLLNRNAFQEQVEAILQEDIGIAAMVLWDLDNLKFTNDTYGHNVGDLLIQRSAQILSETDPEHSIIARMAGDEFLIFFHHYQNRDDLFLAIQKVHLKIISTRIQMSDTDSSNIKVSAGIAWYPNDAKDYDTLLKYSDFAMYDVKNSQKGSIHSFDTHMYKHNELLFSGRKELNEMLECKQIRYAYQPIVDAHDASILGFEALMRPQGKILTSPQDVLRLARAQAQLYRVEYITWTNAMQSFMELRTSFEHCKLFINSIPSMPLLDDLITTLEENYAQLLPNVVVELLETDEIEHAYLKMKQSFIKKWNGCFAIDDYGSGHNSDTSLLNVEADYIKIDIELIRNIDKDPDRQLMVSNIIKVAHQRSIQVIAEGIERREEMETLQSMNVDYLQGYYLAMPSYELQEIHEEIKAAIRSHTNNQ